MQPPDIIVVGSHAPGLFIRVKRVPIAGETVIGWDYEEPVDGGKGSNQAIAAARLGARVSFVGCIGNDRIGREVEGWLKEEGIGISHLRRSEKMPTGVGFIMLNDEGIPAMVTSMGANSELNEHDVDQALRDLKGAKLLLTQFEINPAVAIYAARQAHQQGLIAIVNPAPAPGQGMHDLQDLDILCPNESEAKVMLGLSPDVDEEPCALAHRLKALSGVKSVMMTLGERGVAIADENGDCLIAAPQARVVDTSGAGDAFCAAVAVALVHGYSQRAAAEWGCQVAALSVTRPGTIPAYPSQKEVEEFLKKNKIGSPDREKN